MRIFTWLAFLLKALPALKFDSTYSDFNLNQNESATDPMDYWGTWPDHEYHPSPRNWRVPFYSLMLDRFANGDAFNDDANGTVYETDVTSTNMRFGGDVLGLLDSLDYIHGMGVRGIYIVGSIFINLPWMADSFSPLDLTLLDLHFGTLSDWRRVVDEIHKRGMYIILDNTFNTLGDLLEFPQTANTSTSFRPTEWPTRYKSDRHYHDFETSDRYLANCPWPLPRFWDEDGFPIPLGRIHVDKGCYKSDFDQYGDSGAFDTEVEAHQRQLTKFSSAQDRLREWNPRVLQKIEHFSCLAIRMLDIDGYRIDKAVQVTVDAQSHFSKSIRKCAKKHGKNNFLISGEVVSEMGLSSVYFGRGRQPDMVPMNAEVALSLANDSVEQSSFLRDREDSALDGAVFHYGLYRAIVIFLGIDGELSLPSGSRQFNFVDMWQGQRGYLLTDDLFNTNTGLFDPRHMWGVSNQDVFRWPSTVNGGSKLLLGLFITTFHFPGIPILSWGDEQAFYIMDSTTENYLFGRQPMTSSIAWQMHGCYQMSSSAYYQLPLAPTRVGCYDDKISLDHRDPSHPIRNVLKIMNKRREEFPTLKDGWFLEQLSNHTRHEALTGSLGLPTEFGMWSTVRDEFAPFQNLSTSQARNEPVWLLYQNENSRTIYSEGCIASPFPHGTEVKNLLYPYDEHTVDEIREDEILAVSKRARGCIRQLDLWPFDFKALVVKSSWMPPPPVITRFLPGHDARIETKAGPGNWDVLNISLSFSSQMNCTELTSSITISSQTDYDVVPNIKSDSVRCNAEPSNEVPEYVGQPVSVFTWTAALESVYPGVHAITIRNATTEDGLQFTDSNDRFLFRVGAKDNPIVFPRSAMFPDNVLSRGENGKLAVNLRAAGANKWRYSLNWGASWSDWQTYSSGRHVLEPQTQRPWVGKTGKSWSGEHIILQYWSKIAGSSSFVQHIDFENLDAQPRLFPHLFAHGDFNLHGHDRSVAKEVEFDEEWKFHFMGEWPDGFSLNVWGMGANGEQDLSFVYGDVDHNNVLDRWIPSMLSKVMIPFDRPPKYPYLAYEFALSRDSYRYELRPKGNRWHQILLFLFFAFAPAIGGITGLRIYQKHHCRIVSNRSGSSDNPHCTTPRNLLNKSPRHFRKRRVLIATMEYDIPDYDIDIRVGGLGTMSTLMGKHLTEYDLIWVIPCVGGIVYPRGSIGKPILACVSGRTVEVQVFHHTLKNVTYVMLDSPVFRCQTKTQPYPTRMDDMQSAIYYSAWNSCIAEAIRRFSPDIYHINDYHGALAPLHLLPNTVPCVLSLHNAEYQGLWSVRTPEEEAQVCAVFNISTKTMKRYVQFGAVFNLLHAAASYIRIHQSGVGVVGVSDVYSERCMARYPILWSLKSVGSLPNPDPSQLDHVQEAVQQHEAKTILKIRTQGWANLEQDPSAELFIFVGRLSKQKGTDLIADVFPDVLQRNRKVQLLCVGPVVDMYGKLTAIKLKKIAKQFPRRVCCIPEFTQLPPFIFGGADFVLIPSRDEPYGLVAAQFGRKGALAVGAQVGGLGKVPGWWYTVECTTTRHLLTQFKSTLLLALQSSGEERDLMRTAALRQSFPISQWKARLERLYEEVSSNQRITRASQRTCEPLKLISRNIKEAVLPGQGYRLNRYLEDDDSVTLDDKLVAEAIWTNTQTASMDELLCVRSHCLNNVAATFSDENGEVAAKFMGMLSGLRPENSERELCIEDFLISSERSWFEKIRNAQLDLPTTPTSFFNWTRNNWWYQKQKRYLVYDAIKVRNSNELERAGLDLPVHCNSTSTVWKTQR
ncbi:Cell wall alpha-1,3-glucan synthase ags1 [Coniothyrium glycines]